MACTAREVPPGALIVDRVDVLGAEKVDGDEIKPRIATAKTQRALGGLLQAIPMLTYIDALTVEYRTFDRMVLDRDLERVRRWYRARGFYDVEVRAGRVVRTEEGHVRIEIVVSEGEPVLVGAVDLDFADWQRALSVNAKLVDLVADFRSGPIESPETAPRFDEDRYDKLKAALRRALTSNGYAYAKVTGKVDVDIAKRVARVKLSVTAGPFCHFGDVTFEGLGEVPRKPIHDALDIRPGQVFSTQKIDDGHHVLADFQIFGSVEIEAKTSAEGEPYRTQIPIVVRVQPIKFRGVKLGVGAELGQRFDAHGVVGWEDRNLLGGLRTLAVELKPSLVFFPLAADTLLDPPDSIIVIPEIELDVRFKQPGFFESRTNLLIEAGARFYRPRTLPEPEKFNSDVDNVVVYRELDGSVGVERKFRFPYWGGFTFYGSPLVKIQYESPTSFNFDAPPDGFQDVLIPRLELIAELDFRRNREGKPDKNDPAQGVYLGLNAQFAALGDAEDVRLRPEVRFYAPLASNVLFALRWASGYLFPFNYGESLLGDAEASEQMRARDLQLLGFRAFYSGGPVSNRGYTFREVGPHAVLGFLSQNSSGGELLPSGGRGMWEVSAELRFPLAESLLGVLFVDASDVVRNLTDFRVTHPHIAPGLGLRYVSPVGKVRLDLGFRPPYLQEVGEERVTESNGGPAPGETDVPFAFHIAIGEAI